MERTRKKAGTESRRLFIQNPGFRVERCGRCRVIRCICQKFRDSPATLQGKEVRALCQRSIMSCFLNICVWIYLHIIRGLQRPRRVDGHQRRWPVRNVRRRPIPTRPAIIEAQYTPECADTLALLGRVFWQDEHSRGRSIAGADAMKPRAEGDRHCSTDMISPL